DREIGGTGPRGSEEEADDEDDEEQPFTADVGTEDNGQYDGDGSRTEIAERDHRFASDRVEEPTEDDRAQEVRQRPQDDEDRHGRLGDAVEAVEDRSEVEGDAVVEERLPDEEHEAQDGALRVFLEGDLRDLGER